MKKHLLDSLFLFLSEVHIRSKRRMEVDGELESRIPGSLQFSVLVVFVSKRMVHQAMVGFIRADHKKGVTKSCIVRQSPVLFCNRGCGGIHQFSFVDTMNHLRIGVNSMLLKEADEAMRGAWSEHEQKGEESHETNLEHTNE